MSFETDFSNGFSESQKISKPLSTSSEGSLDVNTNVVLRVECISRSSLKVKKPVVVTLQAYTGCNDTLSTQTLFLAEVCVLSVHAALDGLWDLGGFCSAGLQKIILPQGGA